MLKACTTTVFTFPIHPTIENQEFLLELKWITVQYRTNYVYLSKEHLDGLYLWQLQVKKKKKRKKKSSCIVFMVDKAGLSLYQITVSYVWLTDLVAILPVW
jgi:hypothetical protein